ncbi:MAG: rhomboid family intramembrane serine protease [Marinobacter sp.]|uniref:rhomboid family intramembrane serine protease n=1 Tax=Marinobacter sp. TaxID=50741 RepID=UPI001B710F43|nr:rhomboid family intramembrane serine protease [Marinobacter sp.]MBQ0747166.1 rhomboid family intramembrane serine protease [Marinobacter sp.]MBQ0814820.1 rhomboid family intramembrane serine protease [Marinobacter sp.]
MYRVKQLDASLDLGGFSQWLRSQGVPHRISAEGDFQVLWLENQEHAEPVLEALDRFLAEPEIRQAVEHQNRSPVFVQGRWQPSPRHAPLVLGIIVLAVLMAWFTSLGSNQFTANLLIIDPRAYGWGSMAERLDALSATLASGQVWRLFTPDFLHFSWTHIIFNSVMLWFLGSQIEWFDGRTRLVVLFIVTSLVSNGLQYMVSGPFFGGLSGVVYGILGYCWLSQRTLPRFQFPPALVTFAVVWMVIGFTPVPEMLGLGRMANEAHLGGFVAGLALAAILPARRKPQA